MKGTEGDCVEKLWNEICGGEKREKPREKPTYDLQVPYTIFEQRRLKLNCHFLTYRIILYITTI